MPATSLAKGLLALLLSVGALAQDCSKTCQSFGKDFADGGVYFQNVKSTDPFTATEYFTGCQNDTAYNVLQDPKGNQFECNNTPMVPNGAIQSLTCPIKKSQLVSGKWSIIVLSNNGQCAPIDYIRTFSLNVGTQVTTTVPPTVTAKFTSTPVVTVTKTISSTLTSTGKATTTTVRSMNPYTITITPLPTITIITKGIISVTQTVQKPSVVGTTTVTTTTPCANAMAAAATVDQADRPNSATPVTVLKDSPLTSGVVRRDVPAGPTARAGSLEYKRAILAGRVPEPEPAADSEVVHAEIVKRAPDAPTVTVTGGTPVTVTTTITAVKTTNTATTTTFITATITPTVTVTSGQSPPTTKTATQQTITATLYIPITTVTTTQYTTTVSIASTATKCA